MPQVLNDAQKLDFRLAGYYHTKHYGLSINKNTELICRNGACRDYRLLFAVSMAKTRQTCQGKAVRKL
jgi:hypothetical protein